MSLFPLYDNLDISSVQNSEVTGEEWKKICRIISSCDPKISEIIFVLIIHDYISRTKKIPKSFLKTSESQKGIIITSDKFPLELKKKCYVLLKKAGII